MMLWNGDESLVAYRTILTYGCFEVQECETPEEAGEWDTNK